MDAGLACAFHCTRQECEPARALKIFGRSCAHSSTASQPHTPDRIRTVCATRGVCCTSVVCTARQTFVYFQLVFNMLRARNQLRTRAIAAAAASVIIGSGVIRKRGVWVKGFRREFSHSPLISRLHEHYPDDFKTYLRMDSVLFDQLLEKVSPSIQKQDTKMRSPTFHKHGWLLYFAINFSVNSTVHCFSIIHPLQNIQNK